VPGASSIVVNLKGVLENNYDFVTITGTDKVERKYTGDMDKNITLSGNTATIHFTSDSSVTKNGFSVDVEAEDSSLIKIISISNATTDEGYDAIHHVILNSTTKKSTKVKLYVIEGYDNGSTKNSDIENKPVLPKQFSMDDNNNIIIPAGIKEFDLIIRATMDEDEDEHIENYVIVTDPSLTFKKPKDMYFDIDYNKNVTGIGMVFNVGS